jgi:hypothetical protein
MLCSGKIRFRFDFIDTPGNLLALRVTAADEHGRAQVSELAGLPRPHPHPRKKFLEFRLRTFVFFPMRLRLNAETQSAQTSMSVSIMFGA